MGALVNLKKYRKRVERDRSATAADANRQRFGRTKAERHQNELRKTRESHLLDQHRIDGEDAS